MCPLRGTRVRKDLLATAYVRVNAMVLCTGVTRKVSTSSSRVRSSRSILIDDKVIDDS